MSRYAVVFSREAEDQLADLYNYIADAATPTIAEHYTDAIVRFCESLKDFPHKGFRREDIRPGLRVTHYKGRCVIAFAIDDTTMIVTILGVFYGGRNYADILIVE
jgi:toxin ParE1/3/4